MTLFNEKSEIWLFNKKYASYRELNKQVESYLNILNEFNCGNIKLEEEYIIKNDGINDVKAKQKELENLIFDETKEICNKFQGIRELKIALFIIRAYWRTEILNKDKNKNNSTLNFRIFNIMFFYLLENRIDSKNDEKIDFNKALKYLNKYFRLIYYYYYNIDSYNKIICNSKNCSEFYNKFKEISNEDEDMNSYEISSECINNEIKDRNLIIEDYLLEINKVYYNKPIEQISLYNDIKKNNLNEPNFDVIIIEKNNFDRYEEKFKTFIKTFSRMRKDKSFKDNENELIFAYFDEEYIFISKELMRMTQQDIDICMKRQQHINILEYYFGYKKNTGNANKYNQLMTYKIADLLYKNNYILPMDKKGIKRNGKRDTLYIPRIEIKNYIEYHNEDGDIDVLFISPFTNMLYNLEYKNYQMFISQYNDLSSQIANIENHNVVEKVLNREKIIEKNIDDNIRTLFENDNNINIDGYKKVVSIILTTKPNYYFYENKSDKYKYFEWIEFKEKIENHIL